jgi:hypothetical protein
MGGKFSKALAAPLDESGSHHFDKDNVCIHCKQNLSQLGNPFNCIRNPKKSGQLVSQ